MNISYPPLSAGAKPLVSIFCPTYNAEKFIEKTLRSILEQDYDNIEIIVSDDCSTDATVAIVKRYADLYPRKIVLNVNEYNLGITDNCNVTLSMCGGKYMAFFAGDDLMYPGKISAQVSVMESDPDCSMTYHSVDVLDGDNGNKVLFTTERHEQKYFSFFDVIKRGGVIGACSIMARRDAIPSYGFSTDFPCVSDWLMHIEIALRGRVVKVDGIYAGYMRHSGGASRKTFETLVEIKETLDFINRRYNNNAELANATRKAYRRYIKGELARLFIAGDVQRLGMLYKDHLEGLPSYKALNLALMSMIRLRFHDAWITRKMFDWLSSKVK